jgi:hypothetical protein
MNAKTTRSAAGIHRSLLIAAIVGVCFGVFFLVSFALFPLERSGSWTIPYWDNGGELKIPNTTVLRALEHKALLLRLCKVVVDYGVWIVIVPPATACGLVKLFQSGNRYPILRYISVSIFWSLACVICIFLALVGFSLFSGQGSDAHEPAIYQALATGVAYTYGSVGGLYLILIITVLSFVLVLVHHWLNQLKLKKAAMVIWWVILLCVLFYAGFSLALGISIGGPPDWLIRRMGGKELMYLHNPGPGDPAEFDEKGNPIYK